VSFDDDVLTYSWLVCRVSCAGNKFPSSFESTVRKILRLLMHVLSHIYRSHWQHLVELQLHPHFNTLVYHVMLFSKQFELVDAKDSDLLEDLFERLRRHSNTVSTCESNCDVTAGDTQLEDEQLQQPSVVENSTAMSSWILLLAQHIKPMMMFVFRSVLQSTKF